jgi:hypothetical protein
MSADVLDATETEAFVGAYWDHDGHLLPELALAER